MTKKSALRPGWTPLTILLMVVGFIAWWPLGLAMLAYILWGDRFEQMVTDAKAQFAGSGWVGKPVLAGSASMRSKATGNVAFDEFREREIRRIEEERRKLDKMRDEFDGFLRDLRRARDQEEFDRFLNERGKQSPSGGPDAGAGGYQGSGSGSVPFTSGPVIQGNPA